MRHGKTTALKCLPLATELLIVFLTADILWQLLCGRPPFSMWGFLLSGGLMTAGNSLFLQKPRRFWQILLLNVLLCAVWIPLLSRTLDLTYPPLLVIQVPLYLFPLCRGYHWGVTPVTVRHLHGAGEYMGLYGLFYLIVASFAPQLLDRVPVLLALLALDLLAVVGMRTSGRNTIRAGSPFGRLPALLVPAVLAVLAVAACALLLAARGELIPIFQAVGSLLEGALTAVFRFLTSLFQGRSAGSAGMSSAAGGGSEAALPVESASGPAIAPQLVTALLLLSLAALVLAGVPSKGWYSYTQKDISSSMGTIVLVVKFANPDYTLKPGQFARVTANVGPSLPYVVVPQRAVTQMQDLSSVWVVGRDSTAEYRRVTLGRIAGDRWCILSGVEPGEWVVTAGIQKLHNGQKVIPTPINTNK